MFDPKYELSQQITNMLIKIEALKQSIFDLPINPTVLKNLRETSK
jgi:hypothetical protein